MVSVNIGYGNEYFILAASPFAVLPSIPWFTVASQNSPSSVVIKTFPLPPLPNMGSGFS